MKRLVIAYDIKDDRRRGQVARLLEGYGVRVQKSVFECELDALRESVMRIAVRSLLIPNEDKLRIYPLCEKDHTHSLAWDDKGVLKHQCGWVL